ncbi:hypothetical protein GCM10009127_15320 [Alteraurantiacibacter aestuarii]|uniref:Endoribonuclease YbeY n=1 Tax=Alteraurantiacibacter aestuarii TaxID=650004 RepID=A0A844ZHB6_9SPHN|nr:rRNA maturation RNase YbeY [Alteraurantiacibacter aestuarii]MXO87881.1 rRNA maturation RNase YbeY [Alteraurantiacibacter aestuarii]
MELDCEIEAPWSADTDWEALALRAVQAVQAIAPQLANPRLATSLTFTSDAQIHALNRQWRDRDKPTNVLSFPMLTREDLLALDEEGPPVLLGDIVLAQETCAREAAQKSIAIADHTSHLIVHGLLHLAGYDHEISPAEAEAMEQLEVKTLALMGIADPYSAIEDE